jgi:diguanylate cyclase (GGDEF)-like protein
MFDIDFFKQLNDTHGHAAGDLALRALVNSCHKSLRAFDIFARFGGEEFIILYPNTALEAAWGVTERVRDAIARETITLPNGGTTNLTVSAGVAELLPGESVEALIRRADDALYRAKQSGRNRSISAPAP